MKLLFITNVPAPYRVDFFNELGRHCELTVLFEKRTSDERDDSWKSYEFRHFRGIFLKGKSVNTDTAISFEILKHLRRRDYDAVICTDFSSPTGMLAVAYMKRRKIRYYLESDGGFAKDGKGFKEWIKKRVISGAAGYFSTAREHDRYYKQYGADEQVIHRYPFTSVFASQLATAVPSEDEKRRLRAELGISEGTMVLSVGQFIRRKGFDVLMNAAAQCRDDIGFYIVGGKPTEEYLQLKDTLNLPHVHFVGFKSKADLATYYRAADVFVLPTREDIWGLVVNEAMAHGLPVITTDRCIAGLEMVEDGCNGYIVPVGDEEQLAQRVRELTANKELCRAFAQRSLQKAAHWTIENMVQAHLDILNDTKSI